MTPSEFKSWFDGFNEGVEGLPTEKQWKKIQSKVKEIDGTATTERIFVDRYRDYYQPYYRPGTWFGTTCSTSGTMAKAEDVTVNAFNAEHALYSLGKKEAMEK